MSESTSAPAGPAEGGGESSPPPASQPAISVSEAARLLSQQRRQQGAPESTAPERRPAPNEATQAVNTAAKPPEARQEQNAANKAETGLSAMERALGVPGGAPPEGAPAAPPIDGTAVEIEGQRYTTQQLREAVLKSADYTKKSQELADQRRSLAAQQEALATVLPYIQPELQRLAQTVQGVARPDAALLETDPQRYLRELAQYEASREEQGRLGNLTALQQQAHERAMAQQVAAANEQLAKEFPFWSDPTERAQAQRQIVEWATTKGGFTQDELRGLTSAHHLRTMMKAAMFDRWVEGAKTAAPATRLQAPVRGAPPPPAPTERVQVAEQAFDAKANVRNAAALLAARRANGAMPGR
jgi:hypothetical protein